MYPSHYRWSSMDGLVAMVSTVHCCLFLLSTLFLVVSPIGLPPFLSLLVKCVCVCTVAGLGILPPSAGFSSSSSFVARFFVLEQWGSRSWPRSSFQTHVEAGIGGAPAAVARFGFATHRCTGNGLGPGRYVGHRQDEHPGKISYYLNRSASEGWVPPKICQWSD